MDRKDSARRKEKLTILRRMTDRAAQMVKKTATTIIMAPTAVFLLMAANAEIQPLKRKRVVGGVVKEDYIYVASRYESVSEWTRYKRCLF